MRSLRLASVALIVLTAALAAPRPAQAAEVRQTDATPKDFAVQASPVMSFELTLPSFRDVEVLLQPNAHRASATVAVLDSSGLSTPASSDFNRPPSTAGLSTLELSQRLSYRPILLKRLHPRTSADSSALRLLHR